MKISLRMYSGLFALLTLAFIFATQHFAPTMNVQTINATLIDEAMEGVKVYRFDQDGRLTQGMQIQFWQRFKDETITHMIAPHLRIYRPNDVWEISANYGKGYQENLKGRISKVHLNDQVIVKKLADNTDAGWELQTENLWFDPQTTLAHTPDPILVNGPSTQITARGLRARLDQHVLEFLENVQTRYTRSS